MLRSLGVLITGAALMAESPEIQIHDGARTWLDSSVVSFEEGTMVRGKPRGALEQRRRSPIVDLLKLSNGHLMLVYNDSMHDRTPLSAAVSTDNGATFSVRRNIATGPHDYAYPYIIQTRDGKIHRLFTSERRTVINHAIFSEGANLSLRE